MTDHTTKILSSERKALHLAATCVEDEIDSARKIQMDPNEVVQMLEQIKRNILNIHVDQYADDCGQTSREGQGGDGND